MKYAFYFAALLSLFSPLAIDMYLGQLSVIESEYQKSAALTLSMFFIGLGLGQITSGIINDKKGLLFLVLFSLIGYIVTSALIFFCIQYNALLAFRFLQGIFASGLSLASLLVINQHYQGNEKQKYLGYQQSIMNAIPATAPAVGTLLYTTTANWRTAFLMLSCIGVIFLIWVVKRAKALTSTHLAEQEKNTCYSRAYITNGIIAVLSLGILFTYVSAFPFVIETIGYSQFIFVIAFGANAIFIMAGGMFTGKYSARWSSNKLLSIGLLLQLGSAFIIWIATALSPLFIFLGFALFCFAFPVVISSSMSMCFTGMKAGKGKLLGYITCLQMCVGGLGGYIVSTSPITPMETFSLLLILTTLLSGGIAKYKN